MIFSIATAVRPTNSWFKGLMGPRKREAGAYLRCNKQALNLPHPIRICLIYTKNEADYSIMRQKIAYLYVALLCGRT